MKMKRTLVETLYDSAAVDKIMGEASAIAPAVEAGVAAVLADKLSDKFDSMKQGTPEQNVGGVQDTATVPPAPVDVPAVENDRVGEGEKLPQDLDSAIKDELSSDMKDKIVSDYLSSLAKVNEAKGVRKTILKIFRNGK